MNKHFHDSRYYLGRAAEHARLGLEAEVDPLVTRVRARLGRADEDEDEAEADPTRLNVVRTEVDVLGRNVEGRAREVIGTARKTLSR